MERGRVGKQGRGFLERDKGVGFFIETWVDEKRWEKIRGKLPIGYRWEMQYARRKNRKGRAIGGLMLGIRKKIETEDLNQGEEKEGIMGKVMKLGEEKWRLIGVYVREDIEGRMEFLRRWKNRTGE